MSMCSKRAAPRSWIRRYRVSVFHCSTSRGLGGVKRPGQATTKPRAAYLASRSSSVRRGVDGGARSGEEPSEEQGKEQRGPSVQ